MAPVPSIVPSDKVVRRLPQVGINYAIPSEEDVERVKAKASRLRAVFQNCISKSGEHPCLWTGLARCHIIAPTGCGYVTQLGIPDNEVTEDADRAIRKEIVPAPSQRYSHFISVIRRQGWISECVVLVPDREVV